jgi:hypothetical protein
MALSPFIAGFIGGILVSMGLSFQLLPEYSALEALQTGLVMSVFGIIIAVFVCYAFGVPVMLAGWAIAHFAKWRTPRLMGLVMACAGTIFAIFYFFNGRIGLDDLREEAGLALLVTLPAGFIAGFLAGWVIGMIGYTDAPANETV